MSSKTQPAASPRRFNLARLLVLFRSAGVGALATGTDLLILLVLVGALGTSARIASPVALLLGVLVQFLGNKLFAFRDRSPRWIAQAVRFAGVEVVSFGLNLLLYDVLVTQWPAHFAILRLLSTTVVYFAVSLPLWSLIFRGSGHASKALAS